MEGVEQESMKSRWNQHIEDLSQIEGLRVAIAEERNPPVVCLEVSDVIFFHNTLRCHDVPLKLSYFKYYPHFVQTWLPNACITTHSH